MFGFLIGLNAKAKKGLIEQAHNKRHFEFDLTKWEGDLKELQPNLEVEFELSSNKEIAFVKAKPLAKKEDFTIHQTKEIKDCIYDYFGGVENLITRYQNSIHCEKKLDFLRIKRFLFTAYNDLFELDSTIPNMALSNLKSELIGLDKEFESFSKKSSYPPEYSYEKIFLAKQIEYVKNEELIETTRSIIKSASIQQASMGATLKTMEEHFLHRHDQGSINYAQAQTQLKHFRKRYVDLLHYLSQQKEKLAKITKAGEEFEEKFFEPFLKSYIPLIKELKKDFIELLNAKAYELDRVLWQRAKRSLSVRRFFMEAGITGTYSSKTFLKYFLRSLDETKIRKDTKELFELLHYLESFSKKNILLIQQSLNDLKHYREYLHNFDHDLVVSISNNPTECLVNKSAHINDNKQEMRFSVIIMEWQVSQMSILEFKQRYTEIEKSEDTEFCAIVDKNLSPQSIQEAKDLGIKHFIPKNEPDHFIDMMRLIL
ncbi:hypothetical protein B6S12_08920 [Helicobacter valdiviensis]|uniref:Uncharacterized protein n=1 Tax=Helicobacter valdiviensis TaxID=1458358 RepID=A0A2W6MSE5_9HELI|nr:hypothetical protein [Helicobacter valdiviensis]PZT47464.1 hypothetical protein B6S12_08920 [Helicobacter valdiviensis]